MYHKSIDGMTDNYQWLEKPYMKVGMEAWIMAAQEQ